MFKKIFSSELGKGTIILLITMNIFNFFNFLFHFVMGRMLSISDYGTLVILITLVGIYSIPGEAIQKVISNNTSKLNIKKERGKIKNLLLKSLRKSFKISGILFLISLTITFLLAELLKVSIWVVLLSNLFIFLAFFVPVIQGVLQGMKKFGFIGASLIIESSFKLIFATSMVFFGFKVLGAIFGILMGSLAGLVFAFYFNREILVEKEVKTSFKGIYLESTQYFLAMSLIFLACSLDLIMARILFSSEIMGKYAVLSVLGKIIFLGTIAISNAMFPFTSEKYKNKEDSKYLFNKSVLTIITISSIALIFYAFFPELIINILYGAKYISISPYLIILGISFSFLSLTNLILTYRLSIGALGKLHVLFVSILLEVLLLTLFHKNILEYSLAFMCSNIIIFIFSSLFTKK